MSERINRFLANKAHGRLGFASQIMRVVVLSAGFSLAHTSVGHAQNTSNFCLSLKAQLASLERPINNDLGIAHKEKKFRNAINQQQQQINKAMQAVHKKGCNRAFKRFSRECRKLNKVVDKMERNLINLKRTKTRLSSGNNYAYEREEIIQQLRQNGCSNPYGTTLASLQKPEKKSRRRTLLERVFGVKTYSENGSRRRNLGINADEQISSRYGTYRTLCVRKSDGYYFPISFSTLPERFENDEVLCQSMCPSSEVGLYVHRMPGQDSEDMVSYRTSISYADEPFAFAYRKDYNPENRCHFAVNRIDTTVLGAEQEEKIEANSNVIAIPSPRPDPAVNPASYDNAMENLDLDAVKKYLAFSSQKELKLANNNTASDRKVRIVGPAFFPVQ